MIKVTGIPTTKAPIVAYVILAGVIVILCVLCPYGSPVFGAIRWWPIAGVLIGAFMGFIYMAKGLLKFVLPMQIAFIVSVPIAAIVSIRNDIYILELSGVVTMRYVGGHAAKALEIKGSKGELYRVEGVLPEAWDSVSTGDSAIKLGGCFHMLIAGRLVDLSEGASIRHQPPPSSSGSP